VIAQGEDVIAGIGNQEDLEFMKNNMLEAYVGLLILYSAIFVLTLMQFVFSSIVTN
jgi:hypothetical protein